MTIMLNVLEVQEPASPADHAALAALVDNERTPADWLYTGDWLGEIIAENDRTDCTWCNAIPCDCD